ncbi:hypothetical protein BU26DRAFT_159717 [Trematosphaeria pertusa]|uniref:Uncharacterized protein n=1 Tax=Trematosphaeria pertusa TaxID=390896 RepID=A0A6A6HW16_9PLEO|nr:uncharacterized protein BU26DRAFT_159717 [Trematosphaeria pertusa]KAF2242375.1 hypothetical protein BU26DRAFT_159717 [Trematosphaeria pertusa]
MSPSSFPLHPSPPIQLTTNSTATQPAMPNAIPSTSPTRPPTCSATRTPSPPRRIRRRLCLMPGLMRSRSSLLRCRVGMAVGGRFIRFSTRGRWGFI